MLQGLRAEHALSREGGRPWLARVLHAACLLAGTASRRTCVAPATRLGTSYSARVPARMRPCFCEWQAPQAMAGATGGAGAALARFEAENAVVDADADAIYHYGKPGVCFPAHAAGGALTRCPIQTGRRRTSCASRNRGPRTRDTLRM